MGIVSIFKHHSPDDFEDKFQIELNNLKHEIDLQLMQVGEKAHTANPQVTSLSDLIEFHPDVFNAVMFPKSVKGKVHNDRCHAFYKSPAFQAVLLQDDEKTFQANMHGNLWYTLSGDVGRTGAHSWLYQMPYKHMKRCEKSLFDLVAEVADSDLSRILGEGGWHQDAHQSLQGFNGERSFTDEPENLLLEKVSSLFSSGEIDRVPPSIHVALRDLVYNETLKLKSCGYSTHQVVSRLSERISIVFEKAVNACEYVSAETSSRLRPLFHRQVLINAFAPFAEDLAYLDALPKECYGHLHSKATVEDQELVVSLNNSPATSCLHQVFAGPLFAFEDVRTLGNSSPLEIGLWLERMGQPIDMNAVFTGSINDTTFRKETLLLGRHCSAVDQLFCDFLKEDKSSHQALEVMTYCQNIPHLVQFSQGAIIGYAVALIEVALRNQFDGVPLSKYGRPGPVIHGDPIISNGVLKYLKDTGIFTHEMLSWCGYGSEILCGLENQEIDVLAEQFLESDLGL